MFSHRVVIRRTIWFHSKVSIKCGLPYSSRRRCEETVERVSICPFADWGEGAIGKCRDGRETSGQQQRRFELAGSPPPHSARTLKPKPDQLGNKVSG